MSTADGYGCVHVCVFVRGVCSDDAFTCNGPGLYGTFSGNLRQPLVCFIFSFHS